MLVFCENKILIHDSTYDFHDDDYISTFEAVNCSYDLPGAWKNLAAWIDVEGVNDLREGWQFVGLRDLWHMAGDKAFSLASGALQFASWFRNARYCSHCGGKLIPHENDYGRECESCGTVFYAPISPAVITAVERDGKLLLAHNTAWPDGRCSVIAGFVEPGERLEEAVKREIREEVNISVKGIKYFGSQTWPFPNSLMLGFTAEYESGELSPDGEEISQAGFYLPDEIRKMNIPDKASIARKLIDSFLDAH